MFCRHAIVLTFVVFASAWGIDDGAAKEDDEECMLLQTHMKLVDRTKLVQVESPSASDTTKVVQADSPSASDTTMDYGHPDWLQGCKKVYLDVGSNIGVQVRKFYEAEKYPDAAMLPLFDERFGPSEARRANGNENGMCVLGFEPNPTHQPRLKLIETAYQKRGWHVHFYPFAAWSDKKLMEFNVTDDPSHADWGARFGSAKGPAGVLNLLKSHAEETATAHASWKVHQVQAIDFSDFLQSLPAHSIQFMKMDIEGAEYETLARMAQHQQLCKAVVPLVAIEAHLRAPPLKLWTGAKGPAAIIDWVKQANCPGDVPTKVSPLDDESYLLDVDARFVESHPA